MDATSEPAYFTDESFCFPSASIRYEPTSMVFLGSTWKIIILIFLYMVLFHKGEVTSKNHKEYKKINRDLHYFALCETFLTPILHLLWMLLQYGKNCFIIYPWVSNLAFMYDFVDFKHPLIIAFLWEKFEWLSAWLIGTKLLRQVSDLYRQLEVSHITKCINSFFIWFGLSSLFGGNVV